MKDYMPDCRKCLEERAINRFMSWAEEQVADEDLLGFNDWAARGLPKDRGLRYVAETWGEWVYEQAKVLERGLCRGHGGGGEGWHD